MQRQSWLAASLFVFVSGAFVRSALADEPNGAARAEALFQSARQLMREGRYAEACPKLAESQRLDPAAGTQLNLAECWEREGRTASSYREFLEVAKNADKNGEIERAAVARSRAKQVETKLTRLALLVPPEARLQGLSLTKNSVPIPAEEWGSAVPIDPGSFVIEARAPGRRTFHSEFTLKGDAAIHNLTIPALAPEGDVAPPAAPAASRATWLKRGGVGLAGLGVVGLTIGTVFGVRAVNRYHRSQDEGCSEGNVCPAPALATRQSAVESGNVSTVAFVLGGVLVAGGAGLFVWGTREKDADRVGLSASVAPLAGGGFAEISSHF